MSTTSQRVKHDLNHFFRIYLVLGFLMKFYFPARDFFRGLWWKAWGHDPKDIEFHLGQIKFDADMMNRMTISNIIVDLVEWIYGRESKWNSTAFIVYVRYRNMQYVPYDQYKPIDDIHSNVQPGLAIIEWLLAEDHIGKNKIDWMLKNKPGFAEWYDATLEKRLYTEEEYAEHVRRNLEARQAEADAEEKIE